MLIVVVMTAATVVVAAVPITLFSHGPPVREGEHTKTKMHKLATSPLWTDPGRTLTRQRTTKGLANTTPGWNTCWGSRL